MAAAQKPRLEIPGMYFDSEKNKYFKIEAGTSHSSDHVKRRRLNDFKAEEERAQKAIRKPYIRRSQILQDPLLGGILSRENGGRHNPEKALAAGFTARELIFQDEVVSTIPMPAFAWDSVTRGLCVPRASHQMLAVCVEDPPDTSLDLDIASDSMTASNRHRRLLYKPQNCMNLVYERNKISSINVNESARLAATTWMDNGYFGIVVVFLGNEIAIPNTPDRMVSDGSHIHIRPPLNPQHQNLTVWASTPAPPSSSLSFVIGLDNHILTIEKERAQGKWFTHSTSKYREILSLDFLHNQPSVILAGDRSGEISLVDLRLPYPELGEDTMRNPSCVTHIKSLDDHRVLVAGPGDATNMMFQYDLRWRKKMKGRGTRKKYTVPILEYPDHHNTDLKFGLDVDVDAGLVAAVQGDRTIQLFSLHGGHKLDFGGGGGDWNHMVECLRFVPDRDGAMKSLYAAGTHSIYRYAW